jgi:hypothetical protein
MKTSQIGIESPLVTVNQPAPDHFINRQFKSVLWDSLGDIRATRVLDLGCRPN